MDSDILVEYVDSVRICAGGWPEPLYIFHYTFSFVFLTFPSNLKLKQKSNLEMVIFSLKQEFLRLNQRRNYLFIFPFGSSSLFLWLLSLSYPSHSPFLFLLLIFPLFHFSTELFSLSPGFAIYFTADTLLSVNSVTLEVNFRTCVTSED